MTPSLPMVLSIRPFSRGFAFALFEAPLSPVDWGIKEIRGDNRNARCVAAAQALIAHTCPDALVLNVQAPGDRYRRIERLGRMIASQAAVHADVHHYSRQDIKLCFERFGAVTRYEIAQAIAARVDAFGHRLPRARRIWEREDSRLCLFDAIALVWTHYSRLETAGDD